jgi:hypothetical protein
MNSQKYIRSREDLLVALDIQLKALKSSCHSYDEGNFWEAIRLATIVKTLVHDGGKKVVSVLTQLGMRGSLRFVSSGHPENPRNLLRELTLVFTRLKMTEQGPIAQFIPHLGEGPDAVRRVQFHSWWDDEKIFRDPDGFFLNRRRLVWTLRDQEGGAHLDAEITDPAYVRLSRDTSSAPRLLSEKNSSMPIMGAQSALMRQIAWELLETLKEFSLENAPLKASPE